MKRLSGLERTEPAERRKPLRSAASRRLAWVPVLVAAGFLGFDFAPVPLYDTFRKLTGLSGETGTAAAPAAARQKLGRCP